ncbi:uncharacterized protein [Phaseolus vulgaris]|uniref:uncharacterized protein n=1 Tax=Phaseolus vulgaris TaxID=3885 RepID=UPI0035CAF698
MDSVLVANEVLEEAKRTKKISVIFKEDYEKAYISGLRQGDPLVPFLFLIVAKGLSIVSRNVVELEAVESLEIGCEKAMLNCFELTSGLKVNYLKSKIGWVGVDSFVIQDFAVILKFDVMKVPFKYLGLPGGECHRRETFWDGVVDGIKSRLGRWKGTSFEGGDQKGGRLLGFLGKKFMSLGKVAGLE